MSNLPLPIMFRHQIVGGIIIADTVETKQQLMEVLRAVADNGRDTCEDIAYFLEKTDPVSMKVDTYNEALVVSVYGKPKDTSPNVDIIPWEVCVSTTQKDGVILLDSVIPPSYGVSLDHSVHDFVLHTLGSLVLASVA